MARLPTNPVRVKKLDQMLLLHQHSATHLPQYSQNSTCVQRAISFFLKIEKMSREPQWMKLPSFASVKYSKQPKIGSENRRTREMVGDESLRGLGINGRQKLSNLIQSLAISETSRLHLAKQLDTITREKDELSRQLNENLKQNEMGKLKIEKDDQKEQRKLVEKMKIKDKEIENLMLKVDQLNENIAKERQEKAKIQEIKVDSPPIEIHQEKSFHLEEIEKQVQAVKETVVDINVKLFLTTEQCSKYCENIARNQLCVESSR
jgi:hypothetical protein